MSNSVQEQLAQIVCIIEAMKQKVFEVDEEHFLDPLPCHCHSMQFTVIREPHSCESYVKCQDCGYQGGSGAYRAGAIIVWNEEME